MLEVDEQGMPAVAGSTSTLVFLFYHPKDVFALAVILVSKRDKLGCIEKAVFFSHHYCFVVEFYLNTASAKIRYFDKDYLARVICLTGLSRMVYFGFALVLAVQVPC